MCAHMYNKGIGCVCTYMLSCKKCACTVCVHLGYGTKLIKSASICVSECIVQSTDVGTLFLYNSHYVYFKNCYTNNVMHMIET